MATVICNTCDTENHSNASKCEQCKSIFKEKKLENKDKIVQSQTISIKEEPELQIGTGTAVKVDTENHQYKYSDSAKSSNMPKDETKLNDKITGVDDDLGNSKVKRAKRFSQHETDLLLHLVMSSNKITIKGRSLGWKSITSSFNASAGVEQRTEKELRERTGNIRKDLYKLAKFQRDSVLATGDGNRPLGKPPTISFEFSDLVKKYAVSLQVKLAELVPVNSDRVSTPVYENSSTSKEVYENESPIIVPNPVQTMDSVATASSNDEMILTTPDLPVPFRSLSEMFAPQSQHRRRRKRIELSNSNSNSSNSQACSINSNSSLAAAYYEQKTQLLADENTRREAENKRRKMWHKRCMQVKNEELVFKKKQNEFWSILINKVKRNSENITELANVARAMDNANPINYDISFPNGSKSEHIHRDLDIESMEESGDDEAQGEIEEIFAEHQNIHSLLSL